MPGWGVRDKVKQDVKVQIDLGEFVKWEGRPQGISLHGYFDISGKEDMWAPSRDGRVVFIHFRGLGLNLRQVERKAEGRSW